MATSLFVFTPRKPSLSFTLTIVYNLEPHLSTIEEKWAEKGAISAYQFCHFLAPCLKRGHLSTAVVPDILDPPDIMTLSWWERSMQEVHNYSQSSRKHNVESLENENHLHYCLLGLFVGIAAEAHSAAIGFLDFRAFILQITIGGRTGGIDENDVKPITLTQSFACKELYHVVKLELFEEYNILVAAIEKRGNGPGILRLLEVPSMELVDEVKFAHAVLSFDMVAIASASFGTMKLRILLVATQEGCVRAIDARKSSTCWACVPLDHPQSVTRYVKKLSMVVFGSTKGSLTAVSLAGMDKYGNSTFQPATQFQEFLHVGVSIHSESITAIEPGLQSETLFTSSLDRTIAQIHSRTFAVLRRFEGHRGAILSMCYNEAYDTIVSCGVEYDVYCWMLERTDVEPVIMRDPSRPTASSIPQLRTVPSKPLAISMDQHGRFKVWDLRTQLCICTQDCEPEMPSAELENLAWTCFALDNRKIDVITAANRKCYVFEYDIDDRALGAYCAHEAPVVGAVFDTRSRTIISTAKTELQTWLLETARPLNRIRAVTQEGICVLAIIEGLHALVLATHKGLIQIYSTVTFTVLSMYLHCSHQTIVNVCVLPNGHGICAVGKNGATEIVLINQETWALSGFQLQRLNLPIPGVCCAFSPTVGLLLIGETGNTVSVWGVDESTIKKHGGPVELFGAFSVPHDRDIRCLASLENLPCFIACDSTAEFVMWALNDRCTWRLARWTNRRPRELTNPPLPTKLAVCDDLLLLYSGDDFGNVNAWDLTYAFGKIDLHEKAAKGLITVADVPTQHAMHYGLHPPCICCWEAHSEAVVTELKYFSGPRLILTGGSDCRMQLFTMGGNLISFLIMRRLGSEGVVGAHNGVDVGTEDIDHYNDLPVPYGHGCSGEEFMIKFANLNRRSIDEGRLGNALSGSFHLFRRLSFFNVPDRRPPKKKVELNLGALFPPKRESTYAARVGGVEVIDHSDKQEEEESSPRPTSFTVTNASGKEVVYNVPPYMTHSRAEAIPAQARCRYAPESKLLQVLYGDGEAFLSMVKTASAKAVESVKSVLKRSNRTSLASTTKKKTAKQAGQRTGSELLDEALHRPPRSRTVPLAERDQDLPARRIHHVPPSHRQPRALDTFQFFLPPIVHGGLTPETFPTEALAPYSTGVPQPHTNYRPLSFAESPVPHFPGEDDSGLPPPPDPRFTSTGPLHQRHAAEHAHLRPFGRVATPLSESSHLIDSTTELDVAYLKPAMFPSASVRPLIGNVTHTKSHKPKAF